jgi:hypothetical protein
MSVGLGVGTVQRIKAELAAQLAVGLAIARLPELLGKGERD